MCRHFIEWNELTRGNLKEGRRVVINTKQTTFTRQVDARGDKLEKTGAEDK